MPITILTPAENRFLQLSQRALKLPDLTRLMPLLRDHPTIKDTSDFLPRSARQALLDQRVDWLVQGSEAWKLLADSPYVINPSNQRTDWRHCALCHKPVRYEYHVVLRQDGHKIVVGSECVKKFMSDEMQYLMTITTEDNIHAVAQYDDLTAQYPQVPEIMWDPEALPNLPKQQQPRHRWVQKGTRSTVTGYLKHSAAVVPDKQLSPYLNEYTDLQTADRQATAALAEQQQQRQRQAQQVAEHDEQAAWAAADAAQTAAEKQLRASADYQTYLTAVATLIVQHLPLAAFKSELAKLTMPRRLQKLVNSYQLGVMATEFAQRGEIKAARLQIVPRYLVADLNRLSRHLAAQRQRDWYDDVFNVAIGFDLTPAQRKQGLVPLQKSWEGRQISVSVYADLLTVKERLTQGQTLPQWPAALTQAFQRRLNQQPASGLVPARKNHVTPQQLRQLVTPKMDFEQVTAQFHRLYALPPTDADVTLSALAHYYLTVRDQQEQRTAATQRLVAQLLKK
ncbi:hypothetical protein [Levilactobacillus enshiensis]|uniref:hypothetical protein n=1 Tax=Levilactobacillus enshiensis TaxID=2590213 RepID=UPI00117BBC50|nr:hypothetical protein [Levilactobacillus enshiensis]